MNIERENYISANGYVVVGEESHVRSVIEEIAENFDEHLGLVNEKPTIAKGDKAHTFRITVSVEDVTNSTSDW